MEQQSQQHFVTLIHPVKEGFLVHVIAHRIIVAVSCGLFLIGIILSNTPASACSRVLYKSKDGKCVIVGRNMDWQEDLRSNVWVFPRGVKRDGIATNNSVMDVQIRKSHRQRL